MKSFRIALYMVITVALIMFVNSLLSNAAKIIDPSFRNTWDYRNTADKIVDCSDVKKAEITECEKNREVAMQKHTENVKKIRTTAIHNIIDSLISAVSVAIAVIALVLFSVSKKIKLGAIFFDGCECGADCKCGKKTANISNKKK
ncbi:MAG: hypothetical protein LBU68_02300 [Rickettsiales bacterium]|jgi:uncharacterized membrane protein YcjF (UPF0283 family)|nr:hypothetical protein [Rickettsiales bacterium]